MWCCTLPGPPEGNVNLVTKKPQFTYGGSVRYGLRVANVFDKAWFSAGDAPDRVMSRNPLNVYGSVSWKF